MVITLSGEAGSGKSAIAQYLVREHGFVELNFAKALKEYVGRGVFDLCEAQLYGHLKEVVDPRYKKSPREILQDAGTKMREIFPYIWIETVLKEIRTAGYVTDNLVISDARYLNELWVARDRGWGTWLIRRPGAGAQNGIKDHPSESEFKSWVFDVVLINDGTLQELFREVDEWVLATGWQERTVIS